MSSASDAERLSTVSSDNPWPGLDSFTEASREFFYGRTEEIGELSRRVQRKLLTVLFGQSGLGKTSILRAGVVPRLRGEGYRPVYVRLDYSPESPAPSDQVRQAMAAALPGGREVERAEATPGSLPAQARGDKVRSGETLWEFLHRRENASPAAAAGPLIPLLIFDQFEEIFTLAQGNDVARERAAAFIEELADVVENRVPRSVEARLESDDAVLERFDFGRSDYRILISLREDYLPHLETLKGRMPSVTQNRMRLGQMKGTQALEAVVKPGGALVTGEVARAIVEFVAGAKGGSIERLAELEVEPPLLSVICRELNERRRTLGQAQISADLVSGNRREILTDFYERSVSDLPEAMRTLVEDRLLTKSGFRDNLALETALEEPGVTRALVDTLVARRLLRIEDRLGVQRVELTHDVLADVIRASRDARQQRVERAAAARATRRQRLVIAALAAAVVVLSIGAVFGIGAQRRATGQASRGDFLIGSRLLDEGKVAEGFAYLVAAGRKEPGNPLVAPRLLTEMVSRTFCLPVAPPLPLPSPARMARFMADGKRLVVQSEDGVVRVIDVDAWKVQRELRFAAAVERDALQPARDHPTMLLVRLENETVATCDVATGAVLAPRIPVAATVIFRRIMLSPDGAWVAVPQETAIGLWSAATGQHMSTVPAGVGGSITPDSKLISTNPGSWEIQHYRLADGAPVFPPIPGERDLGFSLGRVYSSDGKQAWVVYSRGMKLITLATAEQEGPIVPLGSAITWFYASPNGSRMILGESDSRKLTLLDLTQERRKIPPLDHGGRVIDRQFSRDGSVLLTNSVEGFFRLWDTTTGKLIAEPSFKQNLYRPATLAPDGRTIGAFTGTHAYLLRLTAGAAGPLELPRGRSVQLLNFAQGEPSRLVWMSPTDFTLIDLASGREAAGGYRMPAPILGPTRAIRSSYGSTLGAGDALVVITRRDNTSSEWRAWTLGATGVTRDVKLEDVPGDVGRFALLPGSPIVVSIASAGAGAGRSPVGVWELATGRKLATLPPSSNDFSTRTAISPDGKLVAFFSSDAAFHLYEVAGGRVRVVVRLDGERGRLTLARFSADSRELITGDDWGGVHVWDAISGKLLHSAQPHRTEVKGIIFSPDSRYYATLGADESLQIWDGATHQSHGAALLGAGGVGRADFSADNRRIVASYAERAIRVWDIASGQPLTPSISTGEQLASVNHYSPDGRFIESHGSAGQRQIVRVWPAPPKSDGRRTPKWLLTLATICGGQRLTDDGKIENALDEGQRMAEVRRAVAELPRGDAYGEFAQWFLSSAGDRPIAPRYSLSRQDAAEITAKLARDVELELKEREAADAEIADLTKRDTELRAQRKWAELEPLNRRLVERVRGRDGEGTLAYGNAMYLLALTLVHVGKAAEAEPMARELVQMVEALGVSGSVRGNVRGALGETLVALGKYAEAESVLIQAMEEMGRTMPERRRDVTGALVILYETTKQPEKAAEWKAQRDALPIVQPPARKSPGKKQ